MIRLAVFAGSLAGAFVFGSLVEYWAHRLMHRGVFLTRLHLGHHASNEAKGVLPEFLHYLSGAWILMPWLFFVSAAAGWGWLAGGLLYGLFSAYGHQAQHDDPGRCFWMRGRPLHWLHHRHDMRRHNFGLALDWWDRVFGTYRLVEWDPRELPSRPVRWLGRLGRSV